MYRQNTALQITIGVTRSIDTQSNAILMLRDTTLDEFGHIIQRRKTPATPLTLIFVAKTDPAIHGRRNDFDRRAGVKFRRVGAACDAQARELCQAVRGDRGVNALRGRALGPGLSVIALLGPAYVG